MSSTTDWVWDQSHGAYYHAESGMLAVPNASGSWDYTPLADPRERLPPEDKEEGEVDDDVGWGGLMEPEDLAKAQAYSDPSVYAYGASPSQTAKHILRLVVEKSSVLPVGGMAMIDAREGGVHIGRDRQEGQARLRVKEMEVSKTHAVVYWGKVEEEEGWWIVDLGSTHGTFLSQSRLSDAKSSSLPHPIRHLSTISLGHTTFAAHIHPSWPCDQCQLKADTEIRLDEGLPLETPPSEPLFESSGGKQMRELKRKREVAALKEALLAGPTDQPTVYQDRAAQRRRLHPETRPARSASPPVAPPKSSFAAKLLADQGWTPGTGLGRTAGRAEPIKVEMRMEKRGLGAVGAKAESGDWRAQGKERRYQELRK